MKNKTLIFVALLLVFATLFVACGNIPDKNDETTAPEGTSEKAEETTVDNEETTDMEENVTDTEAATTDTEAATTDTEAPTTDTAPGEDMPPEEDLNKPYTVTETLMSKEVSDELYNIFTTNKNLIYMYPGYPLSGIGTSTFGNMETMKDCRILSMTIPVQKTTTLDEEGNFIFTLYVFNSRFNGLKRDAKRTYEIKINAEEHGLEKDKNNIKKVIKVDLTSYDITLSGNETLGFYAESDTLLMAVCQNKSSWGVNDKSNAAYQVLREKAPYMTGTYTNVGTADFTYSDNTLMLDFEWEKTYATKAEYLAMNDTSEYDAMIKALREKYSGKYISVIGDSISTFRGVSNDGSANSDIAGNEPYYPDFSGNVSDASLTYWGKVIKGLGMQTCVINSWSGSLAYGRWDDIGKNMLVRSSELHRDNGTPNDTSDDIAPDVILVYMGINDLNGGIAIDEDLWNVIKNGYDANGVDAWFDGVLDQANATSGIVKDETYKNFSQVYALSIKNMKEKYPNAEIYCLTYQETNHPSTTPDRAKKFNGTVKALAEYFGATVVDQSLDSITSNNCHSYAGDMSSLHPTASGHAIMADNIMKNMYANSKE